MRIVFVLVGLLFGFGCCSQSSQRGTYRIMFYNVENLFHPSDDSLTLDDEFTPGGSRHWTYYRYWKKITAVARVIIAAGEGKPPEIVGLCEIENGDVLDDLVNHPLLLRYGYKYIHRDSPDPRGIDVACLYSPDFSPMDREFFEVGSSGTSRKTRDILHVHGILGRQDSIDLLVNHWTSRYGGVVSSASRRIVQSELLERIIDSLHSERQSPFTIAMGDFNDNQSAIPIQRLVRRKIVNLPVYNFYSADIEGSYKYQGRWETIDHFLIYDGEEKFETKASLFSIPHILEKDDRYTGYRPYRTYIGYTYHGGVSDHLPVILDMIR